jgi:hypothetical protein
LLAVAYAVFALTAARLLALGQRTSCGCFGAADAPVGVPHLVLNVAAVGVAVAATIAPPGQWGGVFAGSAVQSVVGIGQVLVLAYLGFLCITALPALGAARRSVTT